MTQDVVSIWTLISFLFIWVCIFWLYQDYYVALFRQRMFALRDRLFDDAARGVLSFDDPAYGVLRVTMNGCIRFAHLLTLAQFVLFLVFERTAERDGQYRDKLASALADLSESKRKSYLAYVREVHVLTLRHVLLSSPILAITILVPLAVYGVTAYFVTKLLSVFEVALYRMDGVAYAAGNQVEA